MFAANTKTNLQSYNSILEVILRHLVYDKVSQGYSKDNRLLVDTSAVVEDDADSKLNANPYEDLSDFDNLIAVSHGL